MKGSITIILFFITTLLSSGQNYWENLTVSGSISARENHGAVYDAGGNRVLVFGGNSSNGYLSDIWSLDLNTNTWSEIPVNGNLVPSIRHTPEMMMNPDENTILMWSGQGSAGLSNDVWQFNLDDSTWVELYANGEIDGQVRKRYGAASIFDRANRRIVNFAGFTSIGRLKDIFSFSLDSLFWTKRSLDPRPLQRCLHAGAFATERNEMIIFGGQSSGNRNDIWSMQTDTFTWQEYMPPASPPARHFTSLIYRGNGEVVIFGGNSFSQNNYSGALNDLWKFNMDAVTWDTLPQGLSVPEERIGHSAVYLPGPDKMIVFGGRNSDGFLSDVWAYDFGTTTSVENLPSALNDIRIYPNPVREKFFLEFNSKLNAKAQVSLTDALARILYSKKVEVHKGFNNFEMLAPEGSEWFTVSIHINGEIISRKLLVY